MPVDITVEPVSAGTVLTDHLEVTRQLVVDCVGDGRGVDDTEMTVTAHGLARARLDRHGWVVPNTMVDAGTPIGGRGDPVAHAGAWFDSFLETHTEYRDRLAVVTQPRPLVAVLERLIADGVVPIESGWTEQADRYLTGDEREVIDRTQALQEKVQGIDDEVILEAFRADRSMMRTFARDAIGHYLGWCRDRGVVSDAQVMAYASRHPPIASHEHVIALIDGIPAWATVDLLSSTAEASVRFVGSVTHPTRDRWAWGVDNRRIIDRLETHIRGMDYLDAPSFELIEPTTDLRPSRPKIWHESAVDTVTAALDVLGHLEVHGLETAGGHEPTAMRVVTEQGAQARRLIRLAAERDIPLARAGEVAIYRTPLAVLSLAWLRIVTGHDSDRGWSVVLEHAGCSAGDLDAWLDGDDKPAAFAARRSDLKDLRDGLGVIWEVASWYDIDQRTVTALVGHVDRTIDGWTTPLAVLDHLEDGFERRRRADLNGTPEGYIEVVTTANPVTERRSVVIHVGDGIERSHPPLAYAPPLGLRLTRTTIDVDGHPVERPDPNWETLRVLRAGPTAPRKQAMCRSIEQASEYAVVIGNQPPSDIDSHRLGLERT